MKQRRVSSKPPVSKLQHARSSPSKLVAQSNTVKRFVLIALAIVAALCIYVTLFETSPQDVTSKVARSVKKKQQTSGPLYSLYSEVTPEQLFNLQKVDYTLHWAKANNMTLNDKISVAYQAPSSKPFIEKYNQGINLYNVPMAKLLGNHSDPEYNKSCILEPNEVIATIPKTILVCRDTIYATVPQLDEENGFPKTTNNFQDPHSVWILYTLAALQANKTLEHTEPYRLFLEGLPIGEDLDHLPLTWRKSTIKLLEPLPLANRITILKQNIYEAYLKIREYLEKDAETTGLPLFTNFEEEFSISQYFWAHVVVSTYSINLFGEGSNYHKNPCIIPLFSYAKHNPQGNYLQWVGDKYEYLQAIQSPQYKLKEGQPMFFNFYPQISPIELFIKTGIFYEASEISEVPVPIDMNTVQQYVTDEEVAVSLQHWWQNMFMPEYGNFKQVNVAANQIPSNLIKVFTVLTVPKECLSSNQQFQKVMLGNFYNAAHERAAYQATYNHLKLYLALFGDDDRRISQLKSSNEKTALTLKRAARNTIETVVNEMRVLVYNK